MLLDALSLDLRMRGYRPATCREYVRLLKPLEASDGLSLSLTRAAVAGWIHDASTDSQKRWRYLAINALCRMMTEEGELAENPCARIRMPQEKAKPQPILRDHELHKLLAT